ncbi:MAG: M48 family metallopeptidase [Chromatiales bacterium]|nr:M48 family metallopeptidase [Chromatiales bacterium]
MRVLVLMLLSAAAIQMSGCATSPTGRTQLMLVSEEQAISASQKAYATTVQELGKEGKILKDTAATRRVEQITRRLIAEAQKMRPKTARWQWDVKVIDDSEQVNAWCMAGGKMAIYTGLLEKLQPTDDELAQVMGHEISHALANHTAERMSTALATSLGVAVIGAATDSDAATMGGAALAATLAIELPNSRDGESEADEIGMELAARAGYEPMAAVTLWQKMGEAGGATPPQFLSTHPSPANRQQRLRKLAQKWRPVYEQSRSR